MTAAPMSNGRIALATSGALIAVLLYLASFALIGYEGYLIFNGSLFAVVEAWLAAIGVGTIARGWWEIVKAAFPEMEAELAAGR